MKRRTYGVTLIELLVALAVMGVLIGIGVTLLPRQGMAVTQGQRILTSAVQFARFEAIKRNTQLEVRFDAGAVEVIVLDPVGAEVRRFPLDPQGGRVSVKSVTPSAAMTFNSRGVSVSPIERTLVLGIVGSDTFDRTVTISGQGAVRGSS